MVPDDLGQGTLVGFAALRPGRDIRYLIHFPAYKTRPMESGFCIAAYGEIDAFEAVLCLESKLSHLSL